LDRPLSPPPENAQHVLHVGGDGDMINDDSSGSDGGF